MNITKQLAEELAALGPLQEEDRAELRRLILDFFAAAMAGYRQNQDLNHAVESIIFPLGGKEEASVLMTGQRLPAAKAAFMNSLYGHGAELDDGNKKAMGHIGVHVIPAVFALAEKTGAGGEEVLNALAVGYEAYIRISSAAQPGMVRRGFHSTGVAGTLACAAACAKLLGLDAQGMEDAIALATTMTGGLLSYGDSRPAIKPLNPAKAAENGVFAAQLAAAGVRGPEEALEGPNGWFHAVTDHVEEAMLQKSEHLLLHECYYKLYPSCRHTHCGIDAGIALHRQVAPENIRKVEVYIYPNAISLAGQIRYPQNQDDTKFSIHYTMACALKNGSYGIADMDPPNLSPEMRALIDKIELIPEPAMENREKGIRGTRVVLTDEDGRQWEETVLAPKGDPEKPLSRDDILDKLKTCCGDLLSPQEQAALAEAVEKIGGAEAFASPIRLIGSRKER